MRRLGMAVLLVLAAVGCRPGAVGGANAGADTSQQAVLQFVSAARAQDLQAMSDVWGNEESPTRDRVERQEMERRLIVMACHLRHEESRIGEPQSGEAGRVVHRVDLVKGSLRATVPFTTVRNKSTGRWFVEDLDLRPAREICNSEPMTRTAPRP